MMHVLVEAEQQPVEFVSSLLFVGGRRHFVRAETFVATKHSRAGLDTVHREVNDEVQKGQPPHRRIDETDDCQSTQSVHQAVQRQRSCPASLAKLALHVVVLQNKVGNEVLQVEGKPQKQDQGNHFHGFQLLHGVLLPEESAA